MNPIPYGYAKVRCYFCGTAPDSMGTAFCERHHEEHGHKFQNYATRADAEAASTSASPGLDLQECADPARDKPPRPIVTPDDDPRKR